MRWVGVSAAVWTGAGGNNLWTNINNWSGTAPTSANASTEDLQFSNASASHLSNSNDFAAGTTFQQIEVSAAGYALGGNQLNLAARGKYYFFAHTFRGVDRHR